MPRMSAQKRIELAEKMISKWTSAGIEDDRSVRFVKDMQNRLLAKKGMSKRQREWFDNAVLSEPPRPQNVELVERLHKAANLRGMEKVAKVLNDFAYKLSRGWKLSEKQLSFMNKLLMEADDIRAHGVWEPSRTEAEEIKLGVEFSARYSAYYLQGCPGIKKAIDECADWLEDRSIVLDKWAAKKVISLCKGDRKAMREAVGRWPISSLAKTKLDDVGLVLSKPHVNKRGKPCLTMLLDGQPVDVELENIRKERRKNKKAVC